MSTHRHKYAAVFVVGALALVGVGVALAPLGPQGTYSIVSANTEVAEVRADSSEQGVIVLRGANVIVGEQRAFVPRGAVDRFYPAEGAEEILTRPNGGSLSIRVTPSPTTGLAGKLEVGGSTSVVKDRLLIVYSAPKSGEAQRWIRIPLAGIAVIGHDFEPQTNADEPSLTLNEGRATVFARAATNLFGFKPSWAENSLYPVGSVELAPGARIEQCLPLLDGKTADRPATWVGYAQVRLGSTDAAEQALRLSLTTDAPRLAITTMRGAKGTGVACRDPLGGPAVPEDVFSASLFARIVNNPNFAVLGGAVGLGLIFFQFLFSLLTPRASNQKQRADET